MSILWPLHEAQVQGVMNAWARQDTPDFENRASGAQEGHSVPESLVLVTA